MQSEQWTPELDALIAAPQHHKLVFENEHLRVLDTNIPPGEMTADHTHSMPASLVVLTWSDFLRFDAEGNILLDSREKGLNFELHSALWSGSLGLHALKNVGINALHIISVEIKEKGLLKNH